MGFYAYLFLLFPFLFGLFPGHVELAESILNNKSLTYVQESIEPDVSNWPQQNTNWCGPTALQAAIDWVWWYNYGYHQMYSQQDLWDYMKNNSCYDASPTGRDAPLPGTVGDEYQDVRKMNIAYDFGVDPHAVAWTMWKRTPPGFHYHYKVYTNVSDATRELLRTIEIYHEPALATVSHGTHWVLVIGYDADNSAYLGNPGTIHRVRYADPLLQPNYAKRWVSYSGSADSWIEYFSIYNNELNDPDPVTGWYITPPNQKDHWQDHWVTVERDESTLNPDYGMGAVTRKPVTYLPDINVTEGWSPVISIQNNSGASVNVSATLYTPNGQPVDTLPSTLINGHGTLIMNVMAGFSGSAEVVSSGDLSVAVQNRRFPAPYSQGAYAGISEEIIGHIDYVPLLLHQRTTASGQGDSQVIVQNTSLDVATVITRFYGNSGSLDFTRTITLAPNAVDKYGLDNLPAEWYGSAIVFTPGGTPIAVTFNVTYQSGIIRQTFNAFHLSSPGTQWFIPQFLSRRTSMTGPISTPVNVQNVSGTTIPAGAITLYCLPAPGSGYTTLTVSNPMALPNNTAYSFNPVVDTANFPTGWYGSCRVTDNYNVVVIGQIRYPSISLASGYEAIQSGGSDRQAFFPVIQKRLGDGSATSILVQNLNTSSTASVTFYYKASCGGFSDVTVGPYTIPPGDSINHNHRMVGPGTGTGQHNLPDGWCGSLRVMSGDEPIDGFAQLTNYLNTDGDTIMAHNITTRP